MLKGKKLKKGDTIGIAAPANSGFNSIGFIISLGWIFFQHFPSMNLW